MNLGAVSAPALITSCMEQDGAERVGVVGEWWNREGPPMRAQLKRLTAASFVVFFAKGLIWLALLGWTAWSAR